jgi:hypothetical protein
MEHATVVSVFPHTVKTSLPLLPSYYEVEEAGPEDPKILVVGTAINDVYVGEGRGQFGQDRTIMRVPVPADQLAHAIVSDYISGMQGVVLPDIVPGLFWVPGKQTVETIKSLHGAELLAVVARQHNWFKELVKLADDDWMRYKQHKMLSDLQRKAATLLKVDRPWLFEAEITAALSECPSCFEKVHPQAMVCKHCNYVLDAKRFERSKFASAGTAA